MQIFRLMDGRGRASATQDFRLARAFNGGNFAWRFALSVAAALLAATMAMAQSAKPDKPSPGDAAPDSSLQALVTYAPPWVVLTSPTAGSYLAPANITFAADAGPGDDGPRITKVEFYANGALKGSDTIGPYTYAWTNVGVGSYYVFAKAYDNAGGIAYTPTRTVTVGPQAPTVFLTSPTNGTLVNGPTSYTLSANANDLDGTVAKVEFFHGATLIATDTAAPYSLVWSGISPGNYSITAKATDNDGLTATSAAATFTVNAVPAVSISAPTSGTITAAPGSALIRATASDSDDGVAMVEFYSDGSLLATDTAAPFEVQWNNVPAGTYALTAKAYDNRGGATMSASSSWIVNVFPSIALTSPTNGTTINAPANVALSATALDNDGSISKVEFYNGGALLATDTTSPYGYVWSGVAAGNYSITAKATDNRGSVRTTPTSTLIINAVPTISISAPMSGTVTAAPGSVVIKATAADSDDGVAMVEFYNGSSLIATDTAAPFEVQWSSVPAGNYTLTAKAYDHRGGATMSGPSSLTVNALPSITLTSPTNGTTVNTPGSVTLNATATDNDGSVSKVEFYNGGTLLATDTSSPYNFVWSGVPAGTYSITAKATDNLGGAKSTSASTLVVNALPTVSISAPASGAVLTTPASFLIQTNVADADDGVALVEFYINGHLQATDVAAPFTLQVNNLASGTYTLAAKVYDGRGGATWSANSTLIANDRPQVQLTSPTHNTGVVVPKNITLAATATDSDGAISRVEFYSGTTLLGTDTAPPYQLSWTVTAPGDHSIWARAYDNREADAASPAALLRGRIEGFELIQSAGQVSLSGELPIHDPTVGTLKGIAGVSGGVATYEIPVIVPPGRRGMEPKIALAYNSRGGSGIAGMGWSLSGLSSIHRCPATLEQDGYVRAVQLSSSDRLCLDGQRLVPTSGGYGQTGTTYATELESFARVTQLGGALNSSQTYFKVERKSGEVAYYGGTSSSGADSRVVPGGATLPLTWLISREEDRVGNNMTYVYASYGSGETLISSIYYTGFNGSIGDRRVAFVYEDRPVGSGANDRSSTYVAGGVTRQTKRLKAVVTYVAAEPVREVLLNYGAGVSLGTGRSLLQSATDCAHDGAQWICKTPTTFGWQHGQATYALSTPSLGFDLGQANSNIRPAGDFDGDGTAEIIINRRDPSSGALQFYLVSLTPERTPRWSLPIPSEYGGFYAKTLQDFNQDGRVDIVGRDAYNNIIVRSWSGAGGDFSTAFTAGWDTGLNVPVFGDEISHIGDMDGDGRADFVVTRDNPSGGNSCRWKAVVYRNTPNASSSLSTSTFPVLAEHCLAGQELTPGYWAREKVEKVRDFDGDGLPDLWIHSYPGVQGGGYLVRIAFGQQQGSYSLVPVALPSLIVSSDPIQGQEQRAGLFAVWLDVNGDGLDDMVYARSDNGVGRWTLRINQGGVLGPRFLFASNAGIARCITKSRNATQCAQVWTPWLAARISAADVDGDGRAELLVPTRFAANICTHLMPNPGQCPAGDGTSPECFERFVCPEDPTTGNPILGGHGYFDFVSSSGSPDMRSDERYPVESSYYDGYNDLSSYFMTALRFAETGANLIELRETQTNIVAGAVGVGAEDVFGDGYQDLLTGVTPASTNSTAFGVPYANGSGTPLSTSVAPRSLPGGIPLMTRSTLINESLGPGGIRNSDGVTPRTQDVIALVTDGLGNQTVWTYYPLASSAGRATGETPLYSVPADLATRYIDERHIYFNSSMPVVSEMIQSDGVGDYRSWRYGYSEAMYNTRGRGFQGFRTVTEEDLNGGVRTTTSYHQKFPLTSQPQSAVINPLVRPGVSGAIKLELYTWRCNLADRSDSSACAAAAVPGRVAFPYLDSKETWSFDASVAANVAGGEPPVLGLVEEVNADDATCTGSYASTSGFDAYGNLTARTVHVRDVGAGSAGFRSFLTDQCQREQANFAVDTGSWWLDKLAQKTVTTRNAWDAAQHALPAGTANPTHTVTSQYTWNPDRTPASETLQPGVANQQRIRAYSYPGSGNYGLPESVSVTASGDSNGARTTVTLYSPDGYFPIAISNALSHPASTSVRLRDGQPVSTTDPNGLRTLMSYDAFGARIRTQFRGRTDAEYVAPDKFVAVTSCASSGCGSSTEAYQVTEVQDGSPTTLTRFDALGRPRLKAQRQMDGVWTQVATEYNARGLIARKSEPYRTDESAPYWTQFTGYDLLGRLTRKVMPQQAEDGRGDRVSTYVYSGRQTAIQVCGSADSGTANCLNLSRTTDSLGRFVETIDANQGRTRFWYDALGNTLALEDANGVLTRASYNAIGQRTAVADPNQGAWSFAYNALSELLTQTDARNIATTFAYDALGRPTMRTATIDATGDGTADTVVDSWSYDPSNALGQQSSSQRSINGAVERSTVTTFDALARPIQREIAQALASGTQSYRSRQKYDDYYGRPLGQEYPNGEAVEFVYSAYGHAVQERDPATGAVYRVLGGTNARGQPLLETFGDTLQTRPGYAPTTGQITELLQQANGVEVRRLGYGYDLYGNVTRQTLNGGQTQESYAYDALHRLTQTTRTGAASGSTTYGYDAVGNFSYKSDFSTAALGAYRYGGGDCGGGPNAVKAVQTPGGTRTYCFDANGNLTHDSVGLSLKYDHQNLPVVAQRGSQRDDFRYGPDGQRTRSWGSDGARVYLPGYEHRTDTGETKVYVGDYAVITRSGSTRKVEYLLKDRLGSVDAVADASGTVTETRGYDAFGKPRSGTWADLSPARLSSTNTTPKGFTQHEHLNQIELIHMNGRVFDYNLGRFTGVDPFIQSPLNSQSLNPYSYILNNPLSGTDPTGYAYDDGCNRRQSCQMRLNPLEEQQNMVQAATGSMGRGAGSDRVTNLRLQVRANGARSDLSVLGAGSRGSHDVATHSMGAATVADANGAASGAMASEPTGSRQAVAQQLSRAMTDKEQADFKVVVDGAITGVSQDLRRLSEEAYDAGHFNDAWNYSQSEYALSNATVVYKLDKYGPSDAEMEFYTASRSRATLTPLKTELHVYKGAYETYLYGSPAPQGYKLSFGRGVKGVVDLIRHESGHGVFERNYTPRGVPLPNNERLADDWVLKLRKGNEP